MRHFRFRSVVTLVVLSLLAGLGPACSRQRNAGPGEDDLAFKARTRVDVGRALQAWSDAASRRDLVAFMAMIDDDPGVLVIGSDKGEVFKGKAQIEGWLKGLFAARGFSWEMDRIEIDSHGAAAWAFVEGRMVVTDVNGKLLGKLPYRFSAILINKDGAWKWRVFDGAIIGGE